MKTKILTMLAVAAGSAAICAQSIYSLNVVGYANVTVPVGLSMIANQLNTTNNTLNALLRTTSIPYGTQIYKFNGVTFNTYVYDDLDEMWLPDNGATLNPGEGVFIKNSTASPFVITFVGEVMQGSLTNDLSAGYQIKSSMVPQAGTPKQLSVPSQPGAQIFTYNNATGNYVTATYDDLDEEWLPVPPDIQVGQSFFIRMNSSAQWIRNFSAN